MSSYLIVRSNRLNAFGSKMNCNSCRVSNMFERLSLELEIRLFFHVNIPDCYFNHELINIKEETIIVFDGHVRNCFLEWLKKNNKKKRIILWLWNTREEIGNNIDFSSLPDGIEVWSYSRYDCEKYGLRYNTTFYWDIKQIPNRKVKRGVFFVGKDKGRYSTILSVKEMLERKGISGKYIITKTRKYSFPRAKYSKPISFDNMQREIAESKAILDIKVSETAGPSLRALDACVYSKKLITNDKNVREFMFYRKQNVFIIDADDIDNIIEFLNKPFCPVPDEEIKHYFYLNWLKRFEEGASF